MIPQINDSDDSNAYTYRQPDLTYRLGEKTVSGKVSNLESIKQAVYHILSTERYSSPIYDDNYGIELEKYIGQDFGIIVADIETTLRDALCQDDRITDVQVTDISRSDKELNSCTVEFTVYTIYGVFEESLDVIQ